MLTKSQRVARSKRAQSHGKSGDDKGVSALRDMGILFLHRIATPYVRIKHPNPVIAQLGYVRIQEKEKVAGDWRGLLPDGTSVLAEIKTRLATTDRESRNLVWSDLEAHQKQWLSDHAKLAVSLVVFVHERGVSVMRWPIPGFDSPRCSITPERAELLDIQNRPLQIIRQEPDPLLLDLKGLIRNGSYQRISVAVLQRSLMIEYSRARRLLDALIEDGFVSEGCDRGVYEVLGAPLVEKNSAAAKWRKLYEVSREDEVEE